MPVTYQIDPTRALIRTRCAEVVTLKEVLEHFFALTNDPACPAPLDVLLDLTQLTTIPDSGQIRVAAGEVGRVRSRVQFVHCAIVANREAVVSVGLIFKTFAKQHFQEATVFSAVEEAEAWLAGTLSLDATEPGIWI
jgi:hypothetical protein